MELIDFSPTALSRAIGKLKKNSLSCGSDSIPPLMLKNDLTLLYILRQILFFNLMTVGKLPDGWRSPLHARGRAVATTYLKAVHQITSPTYRPISFTSAICKLMELVVVNDVLGFPHLLGAVNEYQ